MGSMNGDELWDMFVDRSVDYHGIAEERIDILAKQIAELREDACRETGEDDQLGNSLDLAYELREYARSAVAAIAEAEEGIR